MNKVLNYRNFKINIEINLGGSPVPRGDKPEHLVVVNDIGNTNYYEKYVIKSDANLKDEVMAIELETKKDIDSLLDNGQSKNEEILESLGYSK